MQEPFVEPRYPVAPLGAFTLNGDKIEILDFIKRIEPTYGEFLDIVQMDVGDIIRFISGSVPQELERIS